MWCQSHWFHIREPFNKAQKENTCQTGPSLILKLERTDTNYTWSKAIGKEKAETRGARVLSKFNEAGVWKTRILYSHMEKIWSENQLTSLNFWPENPLALWGTALFMYLPTLSLGGGPFLTGTRSSPFSGEINCLRPTGGNVGMGTRLINGFSAAWPLSTDDPSIKIQRLSGSNASLSTRQYRPQQKFFPLWSVDHPNAQPLSI